MNIPYFAFYPQDWLADPKVRRLNYECKGVMFELLCHMWSFSSDGECALPDDDEFISDLLNIPLEKWQGMRRFLIDGIAPPLQSINGMITSKRLRAEWLKAKEKSEKASQSAKSRWGEGLPTDERTECERNAKAMLLDTDTESDTDTEENISIPPCDDDPVLVALEAELTLATTERLNSRKAKKNGRSEKFGEFWSHYPRLIHRGKAEKQWVARVKGGAVPDDLVRACINYRHYCELKYGDVTYIMHPATFLGPDKPFEEFVNGFPEEKNFSGKPPPKLNGKPRGQPDLRQQCSECGSYWLWHEQCQQYYCPKCEAAGPSPN